MKIEPLEIFEEIEELCAKINTPSHFITSLKNQAVAQLPQVREVICKWDKEADEHNSYQSKTVVSTSNNSTKVEFYINRDFRDHNELFNWAAKHDLKLPRTASKYATLDGLGNPRTTLTYKVEVDDIIFDLSYSREGMPGLKCYIKNVVRKELVCDL